VSEVQPVARLRYPQFGGERRGRVAGMAAIVTGAGSIAGDRRIGEVVGTGQAAAICLAAEGAQVVVMDRELRNAEATRDLICAAGGEAIAAEGDVTIGSDCERVVETCLERFGRLDILDNNVGVVIGGSVVSASAEDWDRAYAVNLKGMVQMSKFAIPALARSGGGAITNISSITAWRPSGTSTPYAVTKGAVEVLTRAMAADHGAAGIRVNAICPGSLVTARTQSRGVAEDRAKRRAISLLGIEGTGWDVGWACVFLASDEARYITGAVLNVDGGATIRSWK
jgi:NAD(P)-dependent dehydrogenase (short-subunit alcohol dehydrogenase family)